MRLEGRTAIITGSGSGFGEGIAKTFATEGAAVVINDVNKDGRTRVSQKSRRPAALPASLPPM